MQEVLVQKSLGGGESGPLLLKIGVASHILLRSRLAI
jgi:hypothetical protein